MKIALRLLDKLLATKWSLSLWRWLTRSVQLRRQDETLPFPFIQKQRDPRYIILTYHRVNDAMHPFFPGTPITAFGVQMEALRRSYKVLPLEELVHRARERDLPTDSVAITFDDGYRDNYENALPILRRLDLPATVFLVTGTVEKNELIWHDRVFVIFHLTQMKKLNYNGQSYPMRSRQEKQDAIRMCLLNLRRCLPEQRDYEIQVLGRTLGVQDFSNHQADKLSWDEIRTMAEWRITFGSHTVTHPILSRVSPETAYREIVDSKKDIEAHLGKSVRLFAYPNGNADDFNETTKEILSAAGYRFALTAIWGANDRHRDPLELRRVGMWGTRHHVSLARIALTRLTS